MHDHDDVMSGSENHNPNANWMLQWKARDIMYKYSSSSASLTESSYTEWKRSSGRVRLEVLTCGAASFLEGDSDSGEGEFDASKMTGRFYTFVPLLPPRFRY